MLLISLTSCGGFRTYYKVEAVRAQKIKPQNREKLARITGVSLNYFIVNNGGYIVWNESDNLIFVNKKDFKKLYSKKVKGLWTKRKSSYYRR